jgi:hypothetical protein
MRNFIHDQNIKLHEKELRKYLEFLHEDVRIEKNEGTKRHSFVVFVPEHTQTVSHWMYVAAECCSQRDRVPVKFSV